MTYLLQLFRDSDIESKLGDKDKQLHEIAQFVLKSLWQNFPETYHVNFFSTDFMKLAWRKRAHLLIVYRALLLKRDPFLLKALREESQMAFNNLMQQLEKWVFLRT